MRTNIVINDELMKKVQKYYGFKTKREAVEEGLRLLLQLNQQGQIQKFRGKLKWDGNLDKMRLD